MNMDTLPDEHGKPLPQNRMEMVRQAFQAMKALTNHERGLITCWFCHHCGRYVGPGDSCHCCDDE